MTFFCQEKSYSLYSLYFKKLAFLANYPRMLKMKLQNPHDKAFKDLFNNLDKVREIMEITLPNLKKLDEFLCFHTGTSIVNK